MPFSESELAAVGALLELADEHRVGVTFERDDEGWSIGYLHGGVGGDLVDGYTLGDTARAAHRPLLIHIRQAGGDV